MTTRGICSYCGIEAALTSEHVAAWLTNEFPEGTLVTPVRKRHLFGGVLTVEDVCAECNNVKLSQHDNQAKVWWREFEAALVPEKHIPPAWFARWIAKVVYNV